MQLVFVLFFSRQEPFGAFGALLVLNGDFKASKASGSGSKKPTNISAVSCCRSVAGFHRNDNYPSVNRLNHCVDIDLAGVSDTVQTLSAVASSVDGPTTRRTFRFSSEFRSFLKGI